MSHQRPRHVLSCFLAGLVCLLAKGEADAADLVITALEVNQAIQYRGNPDPLLPDNSLPLIRGRRTMVRLYVGGSGLPVSGVDASLRVFVNGAEMPGSPFSPLNGPITAPVTPDREETDHSLNFKFVVPGSGLLDTGTVDVDLIAEIDPGGMVAESDEGNNILELDNLQYECRRSPAIAYIPIDYTFPETNPANNGLPSAFLMSPGIGDDFLWHTWPIPEPPNYYPSSQPALTWSKNIETSLTDLSDALALARTLTSPLPDFLYGWLPGNPYSSNGKSFCVGCSVVAFGNTQDAPMNPFAGGGCNGDKFQRTMAHEIGHLMGAEHNNRTLDPEVGFDGGWPFFEVSEDDCDPAGPPEQGTKCRELDDVMVPGLCTPNAWIDAEEYQFLAGHDLLQSTCPGRVFQAPDILEYFTINGGLLAPGCEVIDCCPGCPGPGFFYPVYKLQGPQELTPSNALGTRRVELQNTQGQVLHEVSFEVSFDAADSTEPALVAPFSLILPAIPDVANVVLFSEGQEIYRVSRSAQSPQVSITRTCSGGVCGLPGGSTLHGEVEIQWAGSDADGDPLRYSLQYSPDQAQTTVALAVNLETNSFRFDTSEIAGTSSTGGFIRLIATDGLNTSMDEVTVFVPQRKPPMVQITEPGTPEPIHVRLGSPLVLAGQGYDAEDGFLPETSLQWFSSIDGFLGNGRLLQATDPSMGPHTVTLRGTDSDGVMVEASIVVFVGIPRPTNDLCASAEVIPGGGPFPWSTALVPDISGATTVEDPTSPPFCSTDPLDRSVWYTFTPTLTDAYTISSCTDETLTTVDDTVIAVYTAPSCAGPFVRVQTGLSCDDDSCTTEANQAIVSNLTLNAGTTYYILVWEVGPGAGGAERLMLRVAPIGPCPPPSPGAPSDHREAAPVLAAPYGLGQTTDSKCQSTAADDLPFSPDIPRSRSVWLGKITPATRAYYRFSTCAGETATDSDNLLGVFEIIDHGPWLPVAYDTGSCPDGRQAVIVAPLEAGVEYHVVSWKQGLAAPLVDESVQLLVQELAAPGNDTCELAVPLLLDTPVAGSTADGFDDYELSGSACFAGIGQTASPAAGRDVVYSFTAPDADAYSFRVTGYAPTSSNLVLYTSTACEAGSTPVVVSSCLAAANRQSSGTAEEVMCQSLGAGQTVYAYVDEHAETAGASFTIEVNRCIPETEPNNTDVTAQPLACSLEGSIGVSDVDAYSLGAPAAGSRLFALADGVAAGTGNFSMGVGAGGVQIERDSDDNDAEFGALSPNIAGATLTSTPPTLGVFGEAGTDEPYRLYSVVQPPSSTATAESEPNNTIAAADSAPNRYFSGTSSSGSDMDFFAFDAASGDLIVLGLDGDPARSNQNRDFNLELLDSSGAVLVSVSDPNTSTTTTPPSAPGEGLVYRAATPGTYYARVTRSGGGGTPSYLLSIALDCKIFPATDLSVAISDDPDPVDAGGLLTYTISVNNTGPAVARNVIVEQTLPAGVSVDSVTPSAGTCSSGSTVRCLLGDIGAGGGESVEVVVVTGAPGTLASVATVTSDVFDTDASDDSAAASSVCVLPDADGDGVPDASDCLPLDPDTWSIPGEVRDLRASHRTDIQITTLTWMPPLAPGGTEVRYNAVRSTDPADFTTAGVCVYSDGLGTLTNDPDPVPFLPGAIYFYLVRAENDCGFGTAGTNSAGVERMIRDCP